MVSIIDSIYYTCIITVISNACAEFRVKISVDIASLGSRCTSCSGQFCKNEPVNAMYRYIYGQEGIQTIIIVRYAVFRHCNISVPIIRFLVQVQCMQQCRC